MSWGEVADAGGALCMLVGALLCLLAGIGLLRLPDVLSRMHAATKPQSFGLLLVLIGAGLWLRSPIDLCTLLLVGLFQLLTSPVAAHMVGRAAYRTGRLDREGLVRDELAEALRTAAADRDPGDPGENPRSTG
ncbi:monovalent cation/H(+) antiporter subunit G [Streptomyces smyrnaeus]|uniref:monovalent cation/H(+) antiporter subunit G n=1 Tax=Streptomyces TaxID=1883 RepID=UPI001607BE23|nr:MULTISPECIES: monovalent cation/H(+) antiporter subunit G [unclassified Streptomyces]MBQ0864785.1 monovalent cation/H(+) antiporter subunit G [Streptomyces sp. RK75]MBQ1120550.1 monovalent cation/H(+) antiporter subunit G [Streptomyces sp. B15]MBQ1158744.1 monovalent cation/H(+) antiporter subunit G [Streptomyces sp. A73]